MNINREEINIVWFKRDLRIQDNEAIQNALLSKKRVLFIYVFEKLLQQDKHYSERHWNFIKQSLNDLNQELEAYNSEILCVSSGIISTLNQLLNTYKINTIFSHQETGLLITYDRDKDVARFCRNNSIHWKENKNNAILRGLPNRKDWFEKWEDYMNSNLIENHIKSEKIIATEEIKELKKGFQVVNLETPSSKKIQKGGTKTAWKYANTFFKTRHKQYMFHISKPALARESCSRLSPYISWGNVSIRQIYQKAIESRNDNNKRHLDAFISRLRWQAHFIQKFEMEHTMEKESLNKGFQKLKKSISEKYQEAWKIGKTGFPLVDASMRCLNETGYLNFRMRALLVSFFTHILWQPWQEASKHLSQMFLDFEPGIHFPQLQMNSGETGLDTLRIYNPIKNSKEHDEDATFIKKWVPELAKLPNTFIHEPYLMTSLDEQFNNFYLGKDYPKTIVELKHARKKATEILWKMKDDKDVIADNKRILKKHTTSK